MLDKGKKTRQRIVSQALELFSVKGYYHTSIRDVLEATGLTKGALYGYFSSKEALWEAAYEEAAGIWKNIVFGDIDPALPPLEKLARFIENDMLFYLGKNVFPGGCFFLNMMVELSGQSEPMKLKIVKGYGGVTRFFVACLREAEKTGALRPGLDHEEIARYLLISLNGAAALYAGTKDPETLHCAVRQLSVYLKGFTPPSERKDD